MPSPSNMKYFRFLSWIDVQEACRTMADDILAWEAMHGEFDLALVVARGGFVPAGIILQYIHKMPIEVAHATSYKGTEQSIVELKLPTSLVRGLPPSGRKILLIEDIVDTGKTVQAIRRQLEGQHQIVVASLVVRKLTANETQFSGFAVPDDKWVTFPWERPLSSIEVVSYIQQRQQKEAEDAQRSLQTQEARSAEKGEDQGEGQSEGPCETESQGEGR